MICYVMRCYVVVCYVNDLLLCLEGRFDVVCFVSCMLEYSCANERSSCMSMVGMSESNIQLIFANDNSLYRTSIADVNIISFGLALQGARAND